MLTIKRSIRFFMIFPYTVLFLSSAVAADVPPAANRAVVVNGNTISREEFDRELGRIMRREGAVAPRDNPERERELRREALDSLISRELLYQESRREGVVVPDGEIDRELAKLKESPASAIELDKTLEELNLSAAAIRREAERGMAVRRLVERRLGARIDPAESEVREYYDRNQSLFRVPEQVKFSHILVKIEPRWQKDKKDAALKRISEIRERLRRGEAFATVAGEVSDCLSRANGGDLGWFGRGRMAKQVDDVVFSLKEGVLSDIVEDSFGLHLIVVTGRKPARVVSFSEGRERIVEYLRQVKVRDEARALAHALRGKAKVEVFLSDAK